MKPGTGRVCQVSQRARRDDGSQDLVQQVSQGARVDDLGQDLVQQVLSLDESGIDIAIPRIESLLQDIDSARAGLALMRRVLEKKLRAASEARQSEREELAMP